METIYGLHVAGGEVRYVGMTRQDPARRLAQHRKGAPRLAHLPLHVWIREVGPANVTMTILEQGCADLDDAEKRWIADLRKAGVDLLNRTAGGQRGPVGYQHTPEERARRAEQAKRTRNAVGAVRSVEYREKMRVALTGRTCPDGCTCGRHVVNPERGAKISAAKRKQLP